MSIRGIWFTPDHCETYTQLGGASGIPDRNIFQNIVSGAVDIAIAPFSAFQDYLIEIQQVSIPFHMKSSGRIPELLNILQQHQQIPVISEKDSLWGCVMSFLMEIRLDTGQYSLNRIPLLRFDQ